MRPSSKSMPGVRTSDVPLDPSAFRLWSIHWYESSTKNVWGAWSPSPVPVSRKHCAEPHVAAAGAASKEATDRRHMYRNRFMDAFLRRVADARNRGTSD